MKLETIYSPFLIVQFPKQYMNDPSLGVNHHQAYNSLHLGMCKLEQTNEGWRERWRKTPALLEWKLPYFTHIRWTICDFSNHVTSQDACTYKALLWHDMTSIYQSTNWYRREIDHYNNVTILKHRFLKVTNGMCNIDIFKNKKLEKNLKLTMLSAMYDFQKKKLKSHVMCIRTYLPHFDLKNSTSPRLINNTVKQC